MCASNVPTGNNRRAIRQPMCPNIPLVATPANLIRPHDPDAWVRLGKRHHARYALREHDVVRTNNLTVLAARRYATKCLVVIWNDVQEYIVVVNMNTPIR